MQFKRKLYKRGSSFETTIPRPLLFAIDEGKSYYVVFSFSDGKWQVDFEENAKRKRVSK